MSSEQYAADFSCKVCGCSEGRHANWCLAEIPADAGATAYECPLHDNCDGGCGHVYDAAAGEQP